jgi:hypothetical protein
VQVVDRVQQKLTGRDFKPTVVLSVNDQVDRLIAQATSVENLAMSFIGSVFSPSLSSAVSSTSTDARYACVDIVRSGEGV